MTEVARVAAVMLAAGMSRRMGGNNKLVAPVAGTPLVRIVAEAALASRARPVVVVTGHHAADVTATLVGLPLDTVFNPNFAQGLSSSLRVGIDALPADAIGVVVLLGDMPNIDAAIINHLLAAFEATGGRAIIVPTHHGQRGNPVVWPRNVFSELRALTGDQGGRQLFAAHADEIVTAEFGRAIGFDVDTPDDLRVAQSVTRPE